MNPRKVFISYSRKNDQDIFEFRSQEKNREFEILIDDEDLKFDAPWKQSIIKKIMEADAAILFISNDALKADSPIRTLELPLIAKRIRDKNDTFSFFPIFLEEVDKETLENYAFTVDGTNEEVNFLEFFQVLDITKQNKLKEAGRRTRRNIFRDINGNITASLKGEGIFSNVVEISKLRQKQRTQNLGLAFAVMLSLFLFARTDTFAKVLINAAERLQPESSEESGSVLFNAVASQLNNIDNLEDLGADDSLLESIADVTELNLNDSISQNVEDFNALISDNSTTTTTLGSTTTTTLGSTTTTTLGSTTTTTLGSTTVDTDAPLFNKGLTAENITSSTVDISWSATDNLGISYYVLREGSFVIYEGSSTSKELEGLMSSKTYTFSVDAYDNAGNFSTSNVSFTTLSGTTTTTTSTTTTIPLAGLCSNENYPQYERLPSDTELLVVWMRVDENCNQNYQPVGGTASAYCFNCGHPFGGSGSTQGVWVWSHMYTADGNHAGRGSGGVFNPISKVWSFPSSGISYYQGECNGSNGCDPSDSYSVITTTTTSTTTTTIPVSITASTVAELVGCVDGSEVGESAVRLWITNTSSSDAYFDVQYTTDSGSTWTALSDGEFISSSAAMMFLTPSFANNTTVLWQWRGDLTNPNSGSYNYGSSITVSGCPVTTTTTSTTTTVPTQGSNAGLDYIGYFTCYLDGGGPNYAAGVNFNMVSGGTGYLQVQYSLNGGGWVTSETNYEISSGSSAIRAWIYSPNSQVQFRYRVSKYSGVHDGVNWSNTFISGQGEVTNPIELNSSNCS